MNPGTADNPSIVSGVIVITCVSALTALVWIDKVNGDALVGLVSIIIGAVLHAAGTASGAKTAREGS